ncbi:MAG: hypothetical protein OXU66_04995 [Gammaproteobacteria bacterium]|nr:hypothetical protein [Gammaproteobacteria bacterium]MDD9894794.1 hypothetical protein [Gammaproteobacteria bacterium]MDD9958279.1 hypothetical protein [Gammaproteobacteria bacterium]
MSSSSQVITSLVAILSIAVFSAEAHAYMNPGTGSMILQALVAGFAVISVTVKIYWYKLVAFFKGETYDPEEDLLADIDLDDEETEKSSD